MLPNLHAPRWQATRMAADKAVSFTPIRIVGR